MELGEIKKKETVLVAMSGGVDSSVAAALLKQAGHEVLGVTLRFWPCDDDSGARSCCGLGGLQSARSVAAKLGIGHAVLDLREEFERRVLQYAWREYARGRTPNPCVVCNAEIKFGALRERLQAWGARRLATGHYARIEPLPPAGWPVLRRGLDPEKDQSYFLFSLNKEQRELTLMPLGRLTKRAVREEAHRLNLASAGRQESQDACVLGEGGFGETLRRRFGGIAEPGPLVDASGREVGRHGGLHRYTIGQRHGLNVALGNRAFVTGMDLATNTLLVGPQEKLLHRKLLATGCRWSTPREAGGEFRCTAQIRYRHQAHAATAKYDQAHDVLEVAFDEPERAIAPGQAVVLYDGDLVLGGGLIESFFD